MAKMTEQDVLDLKKKIDDAKEEIATLNGRRQMLEEQLQKDWGCENIQEAHLKLDALEKEADALKDAIEELTKEIQRQLDETEEDED